MSHYESGDVGLCQSVGHTSALTRTWKDGTVISVDCNLLSILFCGRYVPFPNILIDFIFYLHHNFFFVYFIVFVAILKLFRLVSFGAQ